MRGRLLRFALAGLALLVLPWWLLRPAHERHAPASAVPDAIATPALRRIEFVVRDGRKQSGPDRVAVTEGDNLALVVASDRDDELHLHGYDLELRVRADQAGTLVFEAARTGRFALELHHAGIELAVLEVEPR